jgi:hypothetical protein
MSAPAIASQIPYADEAIMLRASEIMMDFAKSSTCSGFPCDLVRLMAVRIARLEYQLERVLEGGKEP